MLCQTQTKDMADEYYLLFYQLPLGRMMVGASFSYPQMPDFPKMFNNGTMLFTESGRM